MNVKNATSSIKSWPKDAQRILNKMETDIVEGKYLDIKEDKQIVFDDFAVEYQNSYVKLENKHVKNQYLQIKRLTSYLKGQFLQNIDTLTIRRYLSRRSENLTPSTVNKDLTMFKSMFNRAIEWGYLDVNPTRGIKKLQENNERCRWLTEEEQSRLLSYCNGLTRTIVIAAIKTGLRWGEIVTLKWRQVPNSNYIDFENDTIFIHESLSKSHKSRFVPLSQVVKRELQTVPQQKGTDYIFLNPETNKPLGSIKKSFKTALKRTGISGFTFHDLRHTFASQLVRNGVDLYVVQKLLGHSTPKMTQRYAHLKPEQLKEAIEKIDLLFDERVYNKSSVPLVGPQSESSHSTNLAHSRFLGKEQLSSV